MLPDSRMDSQTVAQCLFRSCRIKKSFQCAGIKSMMFFIDKVEFLFLAGTVIGKLWFWFFRNMSGRRSSRSRRIGCFLNRRRGRFWFFC